MRNVLLALLGILAATTVSAVELVKNGKPTAEIVVSKNATNFQTVAAQELQRHLEKISGAKLAIVTEPSGNVPNEVYVGESVFTKKLGVTIDDVKHDGFKIVAKDHHVVVAGKDIDNHAKMVGKLSPKWKKRQKDWEAFTGHDWRRPCFHSQRDYNEACGIDLQDGTGTLYGVYDLLEQLGWRWYMPVEDIGIVYPELKDVVIAEQSIKREPAFPIRIYTDSGRGTFREEFLWQKAMKLGTSRVVPIFHAIGRLTRWKEEQQPDEYYGKVKGKKIIHSPKLSSEKLRTDFMEFLEKFNEAFPDIDVACIGQPDGFIVMDEDDAKAGWNKSKERGNRGRFSDYMWDFILDIRERYKKKHPDKTFSVFAYGTCTRPPTNVEEIPEDVVVAYSQASPRWMGPEKVNIDYRDEWLDKLKGDDQLYIWEHYLRYRHKGNAPPIPYVFTEIMKRDVDGVRGRCLGGLIEVGWTEARKERLEKKLVTGKIGLTHLTLLLRAKMWWEDDVDVDAFIDEYCEKFFGPAKDEMREFYRFAEEVFTDPGPRIVAKDHGYLAKKNVERFFDLLAKAKKKAGDTVYGKRIDYISDEMEPLKRVHDKLERAGPDVRCFEPPCAATIDGDLTKRFWTERGHTFFPLVDMITGAKPNHVQTLVSFRWDRRDNSLIVGVKCVEPKMDNVVANCENPDDLKLFEDDFVEIQLTTPDGVSPKVCVNPNGVVYDECALLTSEDPPMTYTVKDVAVKKNPDNWTVEVKFDAETISGVRPTKSYPWGVNVCRQRKAANETEFFMLSPSGDDFEDKECMGNLFMRK